LANLITRAVNNIFPGRRPNTPLAELWDVLLAATNVAIPRSPQNTSAQGTRPADECKHEDLSPLAAGLAPENAHLTRAVRLETLRFLGVALISPIVRVCLAFAIIAVGLVGVVGVLSLRLTSEEVAAANGFPNSTSLGPTGDSVSTSPANRATAAVASAADQNHALASLGQPRSPERPPDSERAKRLILSTSSSAEPPDPIATTLTEIAAAAPTLVPAAPPPATALSVPGDLSAPKPDATPAAAGLEMPKDTSPNDSVSPNRRVATPTTVIPPSEHHASPAETALLLSRGDSLLGVGDVASARLFYARAVDAGSGEAALRLGETYDPYFLEQAHLRGVRSDVSAAVAWYERARDLGITEAEILLSSLKSN
jgi:hypothetical protein